MRYLTCRVSLDSTALRIYHPTVLSVVEVSLEITADTLKEVEPRCPTSNSVAE